MSSHTDTCRECGGLRKWSELTLGKCPTCEIISAIKGKEIQFELLRCHKCKGRISLTEDREIKCACCEEHAEAAEATISLQSDFLNDEFRADVRTILVGLIAQKEPPVFGRGEPNTDHNPRAYKVSAAIAWAKEIQLQLSEQKEKA